MEEQNTNPIDTVFEKMGRGETLSPEELASLAQWMAVQEIQNQYGQIDLQRQQMDLTGRQLDQQGAEQDFVQDQYFPWYTGPYFEFQKQQAANDLQMSDDDRRRSANSLQSSRYQTEQARLGTQAAKINLWEQLGYIPASSAVREQQRQKRIAEANRGQQQQQARPMRNRLEGY